jgi:hypothetical protein
MAAENYFDQLQEDFGALNVPIGPLGSSDVRVNDYTDLRDVLYRTRFIGTNVVPADVQLQTELGEHIAQASIDHIKFKTERIYCCGDAELKLLESLGLSKPEKETPRPLTFLLKDSNVIGVIKSHGEASCYGLMDAQKFGIVRGAFSDPINLPDRFLKRSKKRVVQSVAVEQLGHFRPVRYSAFSIPAQHRQRLRAGSPNIRQIYATEHNLLQSQSVQLLDGAVHLDLLAAKDS